MRRVSDVVTKTDKSSIPASISALPRLIELSPILSDTFEHDCQTATSTLGGLDLTSRRTQQ